MPSLRIDGIPEDSYRVLRERAARSGQSLRDYLRSRLIAEASQPTLEEVFDRMPSHRCGRVSVEAAVEHIRAERDQR